MDQLIQMVQDRAGIDASQARSAADTVIGFLKDKLPAPVAGQIDGLLSGEASAASPMDKVGGMLGR